MLLHLSHLLSINLTVHCLMFCQNFDLKPETNASHELDFSFGKKDRTFVVNASVFSRKEKDVFMYNIVDFNTYAGKFLNVESNKVKGVELGVQYHF